MILATGGSIVNHPTNYVLLRSRCRTVWLRARAEDHWNRVVAQGDRRPIGDSPHAFAELRALLAAREKLYARADHTIDTTGRPVSAVVAELVARFCPTCGVTVYYDNDRMPGMIAIPVGAFADPTFPPPRFSVYGARRHP